MDTTIFTKIVNDEIPSYKIIENDHFLAFLDAFPIAKGHTLVIPKNIETDKFFDLDKETYEGLMSFAFDVAKKIEIAIPCNRVGVAVLGLEVPHAHVHLVPISTESDLSFTKSKLQLTDAEFRKIQKVIQEA